MKAVVIYDSVFGNTGKIAEAIAKGLQSGAEVQLLHVAEAQPADLDGLDLLVAGSPTRGFRPTPALAELLKRLAKARIRVKRAAAFDTRFKVEDVESLGLRFILNTGGYAAKRIAKELKKLGGEAAAEPEGFYVGDTEGPLLEGELERARRWAAGLVKIPA